MIIITLSLLAGCGGGGGGGGSSAADPAPTPTPTPTPVDTTKPAFVSAVITGNTLALTYDEALDAVNIPAAGAFTVKIGNTAVSLAQTNPVSVNSSNKTVTLTLAAAVYSTDAVTVTYTEPTAPNDTNAIRDSAGNDAASLAGQAVTNTSPLIPKGLWEGTTGTVGASAIVLANGDAWMVIFESGAITRFARMQVQAVGTSYSGAGSQYLFEAGTKETAAIAGTFAEKSTLSSVITAASGITTFTGLAYNTRYETPATQAEAVGSWTGSFGANSGAWTMAVSATGVLTGDTTTSCKYSVGVMQPRPADPAFFDVSFTETCVVGAPNVLSGIASINAAKTGIVIAVTTADKTGLALYVGKKQ